MRWPSDATRTAWPGEPTEDDRQPNLLDLIARIYDTVHESELWAPVLADATRVVGAERGMLAAYFGPDQAGGAARCNLNPESERRWLEEYMEHDVWGDIVRRQPVGHVGMAHEYLPPEERHGTLIHNDALRRDGIEDGLGANLWIAEGATAVVGFYQGGKDRRLFERTQAERLQAFAPHLTRALQLSFRLAEARAAPRR